MRAALSILFAGAALALAGCGADDLTAASAADAVPANVVGFVEFDADLESGQWERVQELLNRFPSRPQLVEELNKELEADELTYEEDVRPALGDTVALVWRSPRMEDVVFLTQPDDEEKLRELVRSAEESEGTTLVVGEVGDWTAVASDQAAIDALADGETTLADDEAYGGALDELPDERLATFWVRGEALTDQFALPGLEVDWMSGALEARENAAALMAVASGRGAAAGETYASELVGEAPADALVFASFASDMPQEQRERLEPFEAMFGLPVSPLLAELEGEAAMWVRVVDRALEFTLVAGVRDEQRAQAAAERLLAQLPLELNVEIADGRLVATTAVNVEAALRADAPLGESEDFRTAKDAAGMPDETGGFLYVNVADAVPLLSLAGLAGAPVPREVTQNLRPLRSVVAWSETDGDRSLSHIFVDIP